MCASSNSITDGAFLVFTLLPK